MNVQALIFILGATLICSVMGSSYSNVYVERDVVPTRYYQYRAPYQAIANTRLSQINTLPSISGYVTPCVSPCVYPAPSGPAVTPVNPSPNVLPYNSPVPNVPIVVSPAKKEPIPYEYSYVVYDENTGDHKAQRELSDGSVVRGEYSFLQPDGYVREVQYVADDISGFNAIVKNFLPVAVEGKRQDEEYEKNESSPPCNEVKNESLKEEAEGDSDKIPTQYEHGEQQLQKPKSFKETSRENIEEKPKEIHYQTPNKESNESEEHSKGESVSEDSKEELKENNKQKPKKGSKEASDEHSGQEPGASHDKHKEVHELLKPSDEGHVPYRDILRCIEAAMKREYGVPAPMRHGPSPLTYIVLRNPC